MSLLRGLKILDFSTLLPGPYATMMLADMGAEVLRVESHVRADITRYFPPLIDGVSAVHGHLNRSKRSISLDLKKPEAIELVKRLVQEYDIVLEQFRPGVMDRLGIGYETLKLVNPSLIYCSITGYGQSGPYKNLPGHDINFLSISGIMGYSGSKENGPSLMGTQVADLAGGSLHSVIGILSAVIFRERTGEGQCLDISMTDCSFAMNAMLGSGFLASGRCHPEPESLPLNGGTFYDFYRTKDGRYFSVGSVEPQFRKMLCEGIGREDLIEVAMIDDEPEKLSQFKEAVREAFLGKNFDEWRGIFADLPACVEPVLKFSEACEHPQIQARNMVVDVHKSNGETQRQIAHPIKSSAYNAIYKHIGSELGENTWDVLQEFGISYKEIEKMKRDGVIA
ncbi:CaiB/BaiF CoA transferase family protein [Peribacillus frigoritolerans]|uniref:CaiB/BaiF CoA transferase family protein n=1 Tax=Peribacillus frigoritolerans TaxID=450367 RepID=UPI0037F9987B